MSPPPDATPPLTPAARAALEKLADISVPAPVAWTPQTWGWAAVAGLAAALVIWLVVRAIRHHRANRYRVEALADLAALESRLSDPGQRSAALGAMPELVKRVALAAWPRSDVAELSGQPWIDFLRVHAGRAGLNDEAAMLLAEGHYRPDVVSAIDAERSRRIVDGLRRWIEGHRVRP